MPGRARSCLVDSVVAHLPGPQEIGAAAIGVPKPGVLYMPTWLGWFSDKPAILAFCNSRCTINGLKWCLIPCRERAARPLAAPAGKGCARERPAPLERAVLKAHGNTGADRLPYGRAGDALRR